MNLLQGYEAIVYNEYADLDDWLQICFAIAGLVLLWRVVYRCCCKKKRRDKDKDKSSSCCGCCGGGDGAESRSKRRRSRRRRYEESDDDDDDDDDYEYDDSWGEPETPMSNRPLKGGRSRRVDL
jgi:hypothetical protein